MVLGRRWVSLRELEGAVLRRHRHAAARGSQRRLAGRRDAAGRLAKSSAAQDRLQRRDGGSWSYAGVGSAGVTSTMIPDGRWASPAPFAAATVWGNGAGTAIRSFDTLHVADLTRGGTPAPRGSEVVHRRLRRSAGHETELSSRGAPGFPHGSSPWAEGPRGRLRRRGDLAVAESRTPRLLRRFALPAVWPIFRAALYFVRLVRKLGRPNPEQRYIVRVYGRLRPLAAFSCKGA